MENPKDNTATIPLINTSNGPKPKDTDLANEAKDHSPLSSARQSRETPSILEKPLACTPKPSLASVKHRLLHLLVTLYFLNVLAWGGMLFLLLVSAAPAMCRPTCDAAYSPRRIWMEIDSQILNALFCLTGLGLAPWRGRDLYFWFGWRVRRRKRGLERLARIHRQWFRDGGLERTWTMDVVVWCNVLNTVFQACLAGCMWGMNRFERPSWLTGLFVGLACFMSGLAGLVAFVEGRRATGEVA